MVLAYLGHPLPYEQLVELLGTRWFGTPFRHIKRLERLGLKVTITELSLAELTNHLQAGLPIIAYVYTTDLSYWTRSADHVVVIVGIDDEHVYVNDPVQVQAPQAIPRIEFELAQLRYDNLCAIITN
jgi:ABC-type bacteriocin/lantibiotic exporter with double-glycine peptidase domain